MDRALPLSILGNFLVWMVLPLARSLGAAPLEPAVPRVLPVREPGALTSIALPAQKPVGIAVASGRMWVTDAGTGEVLELDPATGKLIGKIELNLKQPQGLAFDGQRLWVADQATRQLVAYDVAGHARVRAIPALAPNEKQARTIAALGWDGRNLWTVLAAGEGPSTLAQIDATNGRIVRSAPADCESRGIAFNAKLLYGLCFNSDRNLAAVKERQASGRDAEVRKAQRVIRVLALSAPAGLAHDGARLWVLDARKKQALSFGVAQAQQWQPLQNTLCRMTSFNQGGVTSLSQVAWNVCLVWAEDKGIWISSADIQRTPGGPWIRVLDESGPSEIFTPYHNNPAIHLLDSRVEAWRGSLGDPCLFPALSSAGA